MIRGKATNRAFSLVIAAGLAALMTSSTTQPAAAGSYYTTDFTKPKDFTIVKNADLWHLIAIHASYGSPPPGQPASPGLIHSVSRDLITWQDTGVAIPVGPTGSWDDYDIWAPTTVKVGDTYHLWYAGVQVVGSQQVQKIGHATSTDLTTWTKDAGNPVFDCATLAWGYWNMSDPEGIGAECRDPYVTWDAAHNQWVMFYTTRSQHLNQDPIRYIDHAAMIGVATSTDLVTWNDAGSIVTTGGFTTESAHAFVHNGTWWLVWTGNCSWRSQKCLKYATAPAATGPYTGYDDLPAVGPDEYASEYFTDGGLEYFGREGWAGGWLNFEQLAWSGNTFTLAPTPSGTVTGRVWDDANGNGQIEVGEAGVDSVTIVAYLDNGDDIFNGATDTPIGSAYTLNTGPLSAPIHGNYQLTNLPLGTIWLRPDPSNFDPDQPLAGTSLLTASPVKFVNSAFQTLSEANFGVNSPDSIPPSVVNDLQTD